MLGMELGMAVLGMELGMAVLGVELGVELGVAVLGVLHPKQVSLQAKPTLSLATLTGVTHRP